jgi:hypothetical protein
LDADHRRHAVVELAIRDAKQVPGSTTILWPLLRQRRLAGAGHARPQPDGLDRQPRLGVRDELVVAKTLRRTLLALPGRLTRSARRWQLHLPARWPWHTPSRWPCAAALHPAPGG